MTEVVTVGGQSHGHLIGKPLHHNEKCKEVCIKSGVTLHWLRPITTSHVFTLLLIVLYMLYWYQYCFGSESDLAVVKQLKQLQKKPRRLHSSRTGMVEAMGLNPVKVSEFFLDFLCNCYRCNFITERLTFHCNSLSTVHIIYDWYHTNIISSILLSLFYHLHGNRKNQNRERKTRNWTSSCHITVQYLKLVQ